jgi:hypothetical protein
MKKLFLLLGLISLLAGCASNEGGSSDQGHIIYGSSEWTNSTPKGGPY